MPRKVRCQSRPGVVIVITLLALILLAGLIMYVLNLGKQTNSRLTTQHAADTTAAAGAGWVARSLNTVAMNNVGTAQLIASVQVVDSMPETTEFTLYEQTIIRDALDQANAQGQWVQDGLMDLRDAINDEIDILTPLDDFFKGYDITQDTVYTGGGGNGNFWRSMKSLDEYSQAAMENVAVLAQLNAIRGGEVNLTHDEERSSAMMVPVLPTLPWVRGHFDDFESPVRQGILPNGVDDQVINRGPYDAVFAWRRLHGAKTLGYWVGGTKPVQNSGGGKGKVPIGSGGNAGSTGGSPGKFIKTGYQPPTHYSTYGPYTWTLNRFGSIAGHHLCHSRFMHWARIYSNKKMHFLWPSGKEPKDPVRPEWITSFAQAKSKGESSPSEVKHTLFVVVELKSRFPMNSPGFMSPGSFEYVSKECQGGAKPTDARRAFLSGWHNPEEWEDLGGNISKAGNNIWREEWEYTALYDNEIGLSQVLDADGNPVPQPVYRIDDFMFVGINVGKEETVRNPNPDVGARDDLAAPIDLDHNQVTHLENARREYLTYLSVAQRDDRAIMWPSRFEGNKPYPNVVGIAQAAVFNNHSWDLWTQMWHAQLEPVTEYDDWLDRMDDSTGDLGEVAEISSQEYEELKTYLGNIQPLADIMLSH